MRLKTPNEQDTNLNLNNVKPADLEFILTYCVEITCSSSYELKLF